MALFECGLLLDVEGECEWVSRTKFTARLGELVDTLVRIKLRVMAWNISTIPSEFEEIDFAVSLDVDHIPVPTPVFHSYCGNNLTSLVDASKSLFYPKHEFGYVLKN